MASTTDTASTTAAIGDKDVCIVGAVRTPLGAFGGALSTVSATDLGAVAIKGALAASGVAATEVEEVLFGNVMSANLGQAPARQCALKAGIPNSVPATTVNKVCSSGMKALTLAATAIMIGHRDVVVAGGTENMSMVPHYTNGLRFGVKFGHQQIVDGVIKDGLWDASTDQHMGNCAELCAAKHGFSREDQDLYAAESYRRAVWAAKEGLLAPEIVAVDVKQRRDTVTVTEDEEPSRNGSSAGELDAAAGKVTTVPAGLSRLRPAFQRTDGTVTAGNASPLSDGAAALILVSGAYAKKHSLNVQAIVRGFDDAAREPEFFTTAPALAVPKALSRAGLKPEQVGVYELNEAFSVVALANMKLLNLDPARVNIFGGAVACGHPLGCSGARIIVTLINALKYSKQQYGCAGVCNGGGGASAVVIENVAAAAVLATTESAGAGTGAGVASAL